MIPKPSAPSVLSTSSSRKAAETRFIIVTGGVCSSLGKGIAAASIGAILKTCGLKVFVQKLDPYLNVDPGTMSPFQHGEVFVTDDGAETDLDSIGSTSGISCSGLVAGSEANGSSSPA